MGFCWINKKPHWHPVLAANFVLSEEEIKEMEYSGYFDFISDSEVPIIPGGPQFSYYCLLTFQMCLWPEISGRGSSLQLKGSEFLVTKNQLFMIFGVQDSDQKQL